MQSSHSPIWLSIALLMIVFAHGIEAQVMATIGPIPKDSLRIPASPPFLTLLGIAMPGNFVTDPSIQPKGPVSEVLREELSGAATRIGQAGSVAGAVEASTRTKFDQKGHITEQIENRWRNESDTIYRYKDDRLVSMETLFQIVRSPLPKPGITGLMMHPAN